MFLINAFVIGSVRRISFLEVTTPSW